MQLKYLFKNIKRSLISNILFCLLLTLAGTLLSVSAVLWYSSHRAIRDIDDSVTTIAIPDHFAVRQYALNYITANEITEYDTGDGIIYMEPGDEWSFIDQAAGYIAEETLRALRETVISSDLMKTDERRTFNAYSPGLSSIPFRAQGIGHETGIAANSPQSSAAFIVTCDRIDSHHILQWGVNDDGIYERQLLKYKYAIFTVDEVLYLHSAYQEPRYIGLAFYVTFEDTIPVEQGKQYALTGTFIPSGFSVSRIYSYMSVGEPAVESTRIKTGTISTRDELNAVVGTEMGRRYADLLPLHTYEARFIREPTAADGEYRIYEKTSAPGDDERMNDLLKWVEVSYNSFQVLTTNDPNSLVRFNQRRNIREEGRFFTPDEIEDGARVCLVSTHFANHNDLTVGDTISLNIYPSKLSSITRTIWYETGDSLDYKLWLPSLYNTELEITEPVEYEIIGLYFIWRADYGDYAVSPNTVIIPDNSFAGAAGDPHTRFDITDHIPLIDDSLIIQNGKINETRALLNDISPGYGGLFRFYDQGYDTLMTALKNLRFSLTWILVLSAAGWGTVMFLFLMFYILRKRKEAALLYALGVSRTQRFIWVFIQGAVLVMIALAGVIILTLPLYGGIMESAAAAALDFTVSFRDLTLSDAAETGVRGRMPLSEYPTAVYIAAAGQAAAMLIAAGVMISRSMLFKSLDKGRGDE